MQEYVTCTLERERRHNQDLSVIAYKISEWAARMISGKGGEVDLVGEMPFWTEEEKVEAKREHYKQMLRNHSHGNG